jgi:hypothetical protein
MPKHRNSKAEPKPEIRRRTRRVRLNTTEDEHLVALSQSRGRPPAVILREAMLDLPLPMRRNVASDDAVRDLAKAGVLLWDLAERLGDDGRTEDRATCDEARKIINRLLGEL